MQRNNAAIAKLLEAEEEGRKKVQEARDMGSVQIKNAKEQALKEIEKFEAEKRKEQDALSWPRIAAVSLKSPIADYTIT